MSGLELKAENMQPISRGLRAYFALVQRGGSGPTIFDPAKHPDFDLDSPPKPWIDAGWVDGLKRTSETKVGALHAGKRGTSETQYRAQVAARVEFEFRQWGKLQMALAAGSEHFNVLETSGEGASLPVGGAPVTAERVQGGSTAEEIMLTAAALEKFAVGDLVSVDVDYEQQTGFLGTGVPAAFCEKALDLPVHPDYVRRVTFNVAKIAAKTASSLLLDRPLIGGDPGANAGVQKVVAFVDREGGKYFQEWSALFVLPQVSGGRIYFYYPRLQSSGAPTESAIELGSALNLNSLKASFAALAVLDEVDDEPVLCYRVYVPTANASVI